VHFCFGMAEKTPPKKPTMARVRYLVHAPKENHTEHTRLFIPMYPHILMYQGPRQSRLSAYKGKERSGVAAR